MATKKKTETPPAINPLPVNNGKVSWREIVSPENVLLNRFRLAEKGIDVYVLDEEKIAELKAIDENVTINLAGFREIAERKGYTAVGYSLEQRTDDRAVVKCTIEWTDGTRNSGFGNSQRSNTAEKFFEFAEAMAENRSFTRTVRAAINLPTFIVGDEEFNQNEKPEIKPQTNVNVHGMLIKLMESNNLSIDNLKALYEEKGHEWKVDWVTVEAMSPPVVLKLSNLITEYAKSSK